MVVVVVVESGKDRESRRKSSNAVADREKPTFDHCHSEKYLSYKIQYHLLSLMHQRPLLLSQ